MKKILSIFLALLIPFAFCSNAYAQTKMNEKEVMADAAVLMCMDNKQVLYKKNETKRLSPASVTKIMTVLLVLEALDNNEIKLTDKVSASSYAVSMGGSQIWLEEGEQMSVEELLKAVVIGSANDACTALAEYVGKSNSHFVDMMNERAGELGCENTHFENSNGLDDTTSNHYSCAYDLALISCEVMKHDLIKKYSTVWLDSLRDGKTELNNTNKLINKYNGVTGLKTGTTSNAGFCISATASRDGLNLVAVVLKSDTSDNRFDTAMSLLDYGFDNFEAITPQFDTEQIHSLKVNKGYFKEITPIVSDFDKLVIEKGSKKITYDYEILDEVNAPISKNDELGKIIIKNEDKEIARINLVSPNAISEITLKDVFKDLLKKI